MKNFCVDTYNELKNNNEGEVANYIPQLSNQDPSCFGISVCDISGAQFSLGNANNPFCIQSCCKPFLYCLARKEHNMKKVHSHVGFEPSGRSFNAFTLNRLNLPHNPMINAGAIMISSLIHTNREPSKRFDAVLQYLHTFGNAEHIGYDNSVYLSEQHHADRNISLAYYMRENKAFSNSPSPSDIQNHLNLYFQAFSVSINANIGARFAATLANSGVSPFTKTEIVDQETVKDCLSLMYSCGMYDFSGEFAFEVGLPAKSGVAGCILLVVPGKFGMCVWSPPLDQLGNSVRGVELCRRLANYGPCNVHLFRRISDKSESNIDFMFYQLMSECNKGNVDKIRSIIQKTNINRSDYDGRTPLHIAVADGHIDVCSLLLQHGAKTNLHDRWGKNALHGISMLEDPIKKKMEILFSVQKSRLVD